MTRDVVVIMMSEVGSCSSGWRSRLAVTEAGHVDDFVELLYALLCEFDLALVLPTSRDQ